MKLQFELGLIPFLFIPLIFIMLALLAFMVSKTTNIKKDLHLSIIFSVLALLSTSVYPFLGETKVLFWGTPYHLASMFLVFLIAASTFLVNSDTKKEKIAVTILAVLILVTMPIDPMFSGLIVLILFLLFGIWGTYTNFKFHGKYQVRSVLFVILALFNLLGQWFPFYSGIFLYSVTIIFAMLIEARYYFVRVAKLMRNAGMNSIKDPLTNLYNKGFLFRKTEQLIKQQPISLIFIDIDNFKTLNDTKGHDYGDQVLCKVGMVLKEVLENKGYACRFGGEEMVGILVDGDALKVAEQYRKEVEERVGVTLSIGVASSTDLSNDDNKAAALIKKADERMYTAKRSGKNKVVSVDQ
ncbi:GGDEF domain-containing protein [Rummeliibacillus stabekisii]|uniref:GGDEF domain-containing protein n=1 Tax=Rummeliibacillus stabekisii TaxID=241244 RepID=UPI003714CDCD